MQGDEVAARKYGTMTPGFISLRNIMCDDSMKVVTQMSFRRTLEWQRLHDCLHAITVWLEFPEIDTQIVAGTLRSDGISSISGVINVGRGFREIPQELLLIVAEFCATSTAPEV